MRLVCPFIATRMGDLVVSVVCSANLARSAVLSKNVAMSGCFVDERSCSGVGPGGRVSRALAKCPSHRLARNADQGFGLESVSVRERRCSGESACKSLRR